MASYNRVVLIGNLTRDPDVRYLQSGLAVCDIALAVNDRYKDATGQWVDRATYVDVTLWARLAEVAGEYLHKGSPVFVEGRLQLDSWDTPDGQKRSKLKVVCEKMQLLGGRGGSDGSPGGSYGAGSQGGNAVASGAPPYRRGGADSNGGWSNGSSHANGTSRPRPGYAPDSRDGVGGGPSGPVDNVDGVGGGGDFGDPGYEPSADDIPF
ncbi:MAG: single-stranded DNA-binding protein [Thermoguttaceae bacterium]|nr:single-stranded DNA-binding protein [Thermoguttaceae bacterium]